MTESDFKSVEFRRFVRWLRSRLPAGLVSPTIVARGMVDQFRNRWAPTNCPRGDAGHFTNLDLAEGVGWDGDPDELVQALVDAGVLVEHPEHRLLIAKWPELAPNWLRSNVKKMGGFIVLDGHEHNDAVIPERAARNGHRSDGCNGSRNDAVAASPAERNGAVYTSTSLNVPSYSKTLGSSTSDVDEQICGFSEGEIAEVHRQSEAITRKLRCRVNSQKQRELLSKIVVLSVRKFGENWLYDHVEGTRVKQEKKEIREHPIAYLTGCLKEITPHFYQELKRIALPGSLKHSPRSEANAQRLCSASKEPPA
jgi:hypothetical protein